MKAHRDLDLSYYDGFSVFRLVRSGFSLPFPLAFVAAAVFRVIFLFSDLAMASLAGGPNLVWRDAWRYPGLRRATASSNSALSGQAVERWIATRRVLAGDHGADLQQFQADGAGLGPGHLGACQGQPPDRLHQAISQGGQDQAELIGPPFVTRGAVGEQIKLLLLDAVLHLAALAVQAIVEFWPAGPAGW